MIGPGTLGAAVGLLHGEAQVGDGDVVLQIDEGLVAVRRQVARRRAVSRAQIYQWRAALRAGRLGAVGGEVVDFVPVEVTDEAAAPTAKAAAEPVEIDLVGGRRLKVASSLATAELRRLIRAVEGA